jgi:hypothetical protein
MPCPQHLKRGIRWWTSSVFPHHIAERLEFQQAFPAVWQVVIESIHYIPSELATEKGFELLNRRAADPMRIRVTLNIGLK